MTISISALLLGCAPCLAPLPQETALSEAPSAQAAPTELFEVVWVVDGDTVHIQRNGEKQKLRLLSVDTEEKLSNRKDVSPSKPETAFGQETMLWAQEFFASLATDGEPSRVGLAFPNGVEARDVYGRVLCHVILPDGTDFNLKLVQDGWSPYFNKYGNSRICHEEFVAAQEAARAAKLGIWNPETNRPSTPDTPSASRDYERLLPWWEARARAVENFRAWKKKAPLDVIASEDPDGLEEALRRCQADPELRVTIFGTLDDRSWEEPRDGVTLLMRPHNARETRRAVRAYISNGPARLAVNQAVGLESRGADYVQNYLFLTGRIEEGPHGMRIRADDPGQWRVAGPEPTEIETAVIEAAGAR